jgi:hypothetical protein
MKLKLRVPVFRCGRCRKRYRNPLGHVCTTRTDYKKRTTKARKEAAAVRRKARPPHPPPAACRDAECQRAGCAGFRAGREYGYGEGFEDGIAACPREHR